MGDILKDHLTEVLAVAIGVPTGLAIVYGEEVKRLNEIEMKRKLSTMEFRTVVSYATRPKRPYETDGVEHYFISNEQADDILKDKNSIAAYTEIGTFKYFTTWEELSKSNLYVIDPTGVEDLICKAVTTDHVPKKIIVIYVKTNELTRHKRAKERSGYNKAVYKTREIAEDAQFKNFESHFKDFYMTKMADKVNSSLYSVNNNHSITKTMNQINAILANTYTEDTLYLIVGRTCSGKDTICREIISEVENIKKKMEKK